jgi:predicted transposase YdaD
MPKPYDATIKQLLADFADDWVDWLVPRLGMPAGTKATPFDPELSTVQLAADKVFRLEAPSRGLLHIEFQSTWAGKLPTRLHTYNTILHDRYEDEPIYSVAFLLRKDADANAVTGTFTRRYPDGREYLRFHYRVVRVWELPAEELLHGGLGAMPLALLTDEAEGRLREMVERIDDRIKSETDDEPTRRMLMTSAFLLLGMRYNREYAESAFAGVNDMTLEESSTYQMILEKGEKRGEQRGEQRGRLEALRELLLDNLRERFGVVPEIVETEILECRDAAKLKAGIHSAFRVASLDQFQL